MLSDGFTEDYRQIRDEFNNTIAQLQATIQAIAASTQEVAGTATEISGSTLFLPHPDVLPLVDLPILGAIGSATSDEDLAALFVLVARARNGACLRVQLKNDDATTIRLTNLAKNQTISSDQFKQNLDASVRRVKG